MRRKKCRTGGGRKEVGLARAVERVDQTRSPSERERGRETERDGKSGREKPTEEGEKRRGEGESFLCGSVELFLLWKNVFSVFPSPSILL